MEARFEDIWRLLNPQGEYKRREGACRRLWQGYDEALQQAIYETLSEATRQGPIKPNPYYAIEDTALAIQNNGSRRQEISFNDYYKKYGTTEEINGWKRVFKPEERTTVYVKRGTGDG